MNENLNGCPEIARSPAIANTFCAVNGHKLSVYQNGMTQTPQGPIMQTINFCANCGLSLAEVRGDLDSRINAAVEEGIKQRLLSAAANQVPKKAYASPLPPAGGPGIELVRDVGSGVLVDGEGNILKTRIYLSPGIGVPGTQSEQQEQKAVVDSAT